MGGQKQFDALDIISVLSFFIGIENLSENREQSAYNDVHNANDRQAAYLLDTLGKKFEEQNAMLRKIMEVLTIETAN